MQIARRRKGLVVAAAIVVAAGIAAGVVAATSGGGSGARSVSSTSSAGSSDVPAACMDSAQIALKVSAIQIGWIDEVGAVKMNPLISQTEALDQSAATATTDPQAKEAFEKDYSDVKAFGSAYTKAYIAGVTYGNGYDNPTGQAVETTLTALVNDDSQRDSLHLCG